jgi:alcohol dehydrogenase
VTVFSGVHANPTTGDVAAGAEAVAALAAGGGRPAVVAVGGGSSVDAAKGIAVAAVNPERGRDLDYRRTFSAPALPLVAVPTTAGTGTETNAFGVITDPVTRRKFYVGSATARPAAAILDPELTASLPPGATAATGMDALVHALESCMSRRANPWSEGIALQAIRMISAYLPRAVATAPTWRPDPRCCSPRTWRASPSPAPGSASATPSATRSAGGSTSPMAWR